MLKPNYSADAFDVLLEDVPDREQLLGPVLMMGDIVMMYASRGVGKTTVSAKLAHSLATSGTFFKWKIARQVRVAYFDGEMGHDQLHRRFSSLEKKSDLSTKSGWLHLYPYDRFKGESMPNLASEEGQRVYTELSRQAEVIIIDNLLTCAPPQGRNQSEVEQWGIIQRWLVANRAKGKTVMIVHHSGKSGDQLGSSVKENILDTVIALSPSKIKSHEDATAIEINFTKTRNFFGKDAEPLHLEIARQGQRETWIDKPLNRVRKEKYFELSREWGETAARSYLEIPTWEAIKWAREVDPIDPREREEEDDPMF